MIALEQAFVNVLLPIGVRYTYICTCTVTMSVNTGYLKLTRIVHPTHVRKHINFNFSR